MTRAHQMHPSRIQIKRAYLDAADDDGYRVLIDRLWPRGRSKAVLALDAWLPDLAPSTALRKAFHQNPDDWDAFHVAYAHELASDEQQQRLGALLAQAAGKTLTLVYGSRDATHNHALVLLDALNAHDKAH